MRKLQQRKPQQGKVRQKRQRKKTNIFRAVSLLLAVLLVFTQEAPAYAEGLPVLYRRVSEQREQEKEEAERLKREEDIFRVKEGRTLSGDFLDGTGETPSAAIPSLTEIPEGSLRMPEREASELSEEDGGILIETGKNYKTYRLPDGTYRTVFTSCPNTFM